MALQLASQCSMIKIKLLLRGRFPLQYFISFLEGIITFISPCLLPMIPIYISYFAGVDREKSRALKNAVAFVVGFTVVFTLMGAFAGTIGQLLVRHQNAINMVAGAVIIIFGLNFLGVLRWNLFKGGIGGRFTGKNMGVKASFLFGVVFSVGWTPCVGAFLGSALMMASSKGSAVQGILMLLCYSLGLGIPFIASAVIIDALKGAFQFIKKHYRIVNAISGGFLIAIGILMMTGTLGRWLSLIGSINA